MRGPGAIFPGIGGPSLLHRSPGRPTSAGALFLALRPRQWAKNVLVAAAPLAGGVLFQPSALVHTVEAFLIFSVAASGGYLVNDLLDVREDRAHPVKRNRPIASGAVSPRAAAVTAGLMLVAAPLLALTVSLSLFLVVLVYEALQIGYCLGLKHEPVIELGLVSSGFVLRAVAGGGATHVHLSNWFLMAAGFGSLFMVAGKRYAEARLVERSGIAIRPVLSRYTPSYLRFVWTVSAGMLIMTASLWAFAAHARDDNVWALVSVVPFVFAVLRYGIDIDSGGAGEPEEVVLHDRVLLATAGLWAFAFLLSVYS